MGAWIEIFDALTICAKDVPHPSWVRGLKFTMLLPPLICNCAAPFMGAWIEICSTMQLPVMFIAAPFMGAWIEIGRINHTLYISWAAPFMGAWIEISLME